jgi:glutamyl-tRNA synthetase
MLAVVVDDHDMEITHAIRGDDHLTNAFRQTQLFLALGWTPPIYAHIPLIHGADGAKLSKRHGALGVGEYRAMGFLPEAMRNYLLRLGWGHGDEEIIPTGKAIEWFDLDHVGRAAARFDMERLLSLNAHYIREADDARLVALILPRLAARGDCTLDEPAKARLKAAMPGLKPRAKTLNELADNAAFYVRRRPLPIDPKAAKLLAPEARARLGRLAKTLETEAAWTAPALEEAVRRFAEADGAKLGDVAQPLRAALTGSTASPGIFEVMAVLGSGETLGRMADLA